MEKKVRLLLAKPGLDGHDRGLKVLAYFLRNEGFEIIYLGLFQTPESIISAAIQENVDVIGVSIMDGGQLLIAEDIINLLGKKNADDIPVVFGGIIPDRDIPVLKKLGVKEVFGPGTSIEEITNSINMFLKRTT
jgi:methylmalonyl-CoA mutase C-terminal domain/subunit